jgi:hypothetical protein
MNEIFIGKKHFWSHPDLCQVFRDSIQGQRDWGRMSELLPSCSGKFWMGLSPDFEILVNQFSPKLGNLLDNFLRFWRNMLDIFF